MKPSVSVATSVIVLFTAGGFLIGYVTTRAFLPHILEVSEQHAIDSIVAKLQAKPDPGDQQNTQTSIG